MPPQARYEQHDDVGELVLDAPPLNLFGPAMFDDVSTAIAQAQQAKPRALVLRSDADAFSAGADVHVFSELDAESAQRFTERLLAFAHAVEDLPCPTLAIVGGLCLTAGLELSLACDLLWAGEGVQFGLVEAVVGITPLMGGTQRMAERAGTARAREFVMTGGLYTRRDAALVGRGEPRRRRRRAAREGDALRREAGERADAGARGDQADRARSRRPRHARGRRGDRRAHLRVVRDRGCAQRRFLLFGTRTRQGDFHRPLSN